MKKFMVERDYFKGQSREYDGFRCPECRTVSDPDELTGEGEYGLRCGCGFVGHVE